MSRLRARSEIISELRKRCPGADETSALNKAKGDWITWIGASALDEASIKALVGLFDKPATNGDNPPPTLAKTYEFGPDNFSAESLYDMIPECYRSADRQIEPHAPPSRAAQAAGSVPLRRDGYRARCGASVRTANAESTNGDTDGHS